MYIYRERVPVRDDEIRIVSYVSVSCERGHTTHGGGGEGFLSISLFWSLGFVPLIERERPSEKRKRARKESEPFTVMNAGNRALKKRLRRVSSHRMYHPHTQLYLISLYWRRRLAELWWNHVRPKNQSLETLHLFNLIFAPLYHCCALSNSTSLAYCTTVLDDEQHQQQQRARAAL